MESFDYCIKNKELVIHAYVIMGKHAHLVIRRKNDKVLLENVMRDMKKYSAFRLLKEIREHPQESRREWIQPALSILAARQSSD